VEGGREGQHGFMGTLYDVILYYSNEEVQLNEAVCVCVCVWGGGDRGGIVLYCVHKCVVNGFHM